MSTRVRTLYLLPSSHSIIPIHDQPYLPRSLGGAWLPQTRKNSMAPVFLPLRCRPLFLRPLSILPYFSFQTLLLSLDQAKKFTGFGCWVAFRRFSALNNIPSHY